MFFGLANSASQLEREKEEKEVREHGEARTESVGDRNTPEITMTMDGRRLRSGPCKADRLSAPTGTHGRAPRDDAGQFQECLLTDEKQLDRLHGRREKAWYSGPQSAGMAVDSTGRGVVVAWSSQNYAIYILS